MFARVEDFLKQRVADRRPEQSRQMPTQREGRRSRFSLAQRFMLTNLVVMVSGMLGIGWWVGQQIEAGVLHRTGATTALYVSGFVTPLLQELEQADTMTPEHTAALSNLLQDTALGRQIVAFKVWNNQGRVLYSSNPESIGQVFAIHEDLARAWRGEVTSEISDLTHEENILERQGASELLETYSPVFLQDSDRVIAVAEFYQKVDDLQAEIAGAQRSSWLIVGGATLLMYLLMAGYMQRASDTIGRQQRKLGNQVQQLTELLKQNASLHERVRRAAARTTALNERFLRRISAELHDGPAQYLGLVLLRLDDVIDRCTGCAECRQSAEDLDEIQNALHTALDEVRSISAGMGLPQLNSLTLAATVARAVRTHEQRTGTMVSMDLAGLPDQEILPIKITIYRLIQEALNNAYRHAGGVGQRVQVRCTEGNLYVEVSDQGPGFNPPQTTEWGNHIGLAGMRERVESLGGLFQITSEPGCGTTVKVRLTLQTMEDDHE